MLLFDSCQITASENGYLVRLDPQGLCVGWKIEYGSGSGGSTLGVAVGSDGQPVMVGSYGGPITLGPSALTHDGGFDLFVARVQTSGAVDWARRIGDHDPSTGGGQRTAISVTSSDDIVIGGAFVGTLKLGSDWT